MNHPMSEKPTKNSRIIIKDEQGLESLVTYLSNKVYCAALTHESYTLMWDDMVENGNYQGWRYLSETIEVEWETWEGSYFWRWVISDVFRLKIYKSDNLERYQVCLYAFGEDNEIIKERFASLEEAQTAAIKWHNDNLANRPEATVKA